MTPTELATIAARLRAWNEGTSPNGAVQNHVRDAVRSLAFAIGLWTVATTATETSEGHDQ